jgi:hypothetical protein
MTPGKAFAAFVQSLGKISKKSSLKEENKPNGRERELPRVRPSLC